MVTSLRSASSIVQFCLMIDVAGFKHSLGFHQ
jgi:hypothetical protein